MKKQGSRGRPRTSDSQEAIARRKRRDRQKGSGLTLPSMPIEDGDSWLAILREDTDLVPEFATRIDVKIIHRATIAFIDEKCRDYRRDQAEKELDDATTRRTGQLEYEQPPELKDKGIRFPRAREESLPNQYVGIYSKHDPLWKPPPKRERDPGRIFSPEEIEAWKENNEPHTKRLLDAIEEELVDGGDADDPVSGVDGPANDGGDDGFDDAEDFDAEAYEGFEDESTDEGEGEGED
jgi:hypothetical protein